MKQKLMIPGKLPGMNEIIDSSKNCVYNAGKRKFYQYSKDKKHFQEKIADLAFAQGLKPMQRVRVTVTFRERRIARDPDNIQAGIKFILDGLVQARILPDDNFAVVRKIIYEFKTNADQDEIKVELETQGAQQQRLFK